MSIHKNSRLSSLLRSVAFAAMLLPVGAFAQVAMPQAAPSIAEQGAAAYAQVFAHFYNDIKNMGDAGQADAFKKEWQHKYDGKLNSQAAIENAVNDLVTVGSLNGCPATFSGKCLYDRAFRAYEEFHHSPGDGPDLADPDQRAAWVAQWEHKFDKSGDLDSEAGTDSAIRKMRDSLGQRFDYVMSEKGTKEEHDKMKAQFVGIGVPVDLHNGAKLKLNSELQLQASDPAKGSANYGLVRFGDIITAVNGKPVDGMTLEDAMKSFVGKPGDKITVTIARKGADGVLKSSDVTLSFAHVKNPLSTSAAEATGDASVGFSIDVTNRKDVKLAPGFELEAHTPFEGSPSVGKILEGDLIVAVDGQSIYGLTTDQAVDKIRGKAGTQAKITVLRKGEKVDVLITRRAIEQHAVHFSDLGNGVSITKLDQFESQNVPQDMANAIARAVLPLASQALKGKTDDMSVAMAARFDALKKVLDNGGSLDDDTMPIAIQAREVYDASGTGGGFILDLRGNPGGDVEVFRKLAAMTLPSGTMMQMAERTAGTDEVKLHEDILAPNFETLADHPIGSTDPKDIDASQEPRVAPLLLPAKLPMVVLTSEFSASASELLSGTLQANHRATIIGKGTIGKGVGQVVIQLPYGRSLHVTNFEFFPGAMKSDFIGIIPDVDVDASTEAGKDAQRDAAVADIAKQNEAKAKHAAAVVEALKRHHEFFDARLSERSGTDNAPLSEQDPDTLQ
jgi:C-terminal processing protease CtpA/Prc